MSRSFGRGGRGASGRLHWYVPAPEHEACFASMAADPAKYVVRQPAHSFMVIDLPIARVVYWLFLLVVVVVAEWLGAVSLNELLLGHYSLRRQASAC